MPNTSRLLLLLGTLAAVPRPASVQSPSPGVLFAWGTINVLVVPDSAFGLRFLSAITPAGGHGGVGEKTFEEEFIPDSALRWSAQVDSLLTHAVPDTGPVILSAMLRGRWGGVLAFAVRRAARHSEPELVLVEFQHGGRQPFRIQLTRSTAAAFAKGVHEQAPQARWAPPPPVLLSAVTQPDSARTRPDTLLPDTLLPAQFSPPRFTHGAGLSYPVSLQNQGLAGVVWVSFTVDTTGLPEPSSIHVIYSSDPEFTQSVRTWLRGAHFDPARMWGHAMRLVVDMPITFTLY